MKRRTGIWLAAGALVLLALGAAGARVPRPRAADPSDDKVPAANDPDKFAWELFLEINRPAGKPREVFWETWAVEQNVFADPNKAPTWPGAKAARLLRAVRQHELRKGPDPEKRGQFPDLPGDRAPGGEEVRINEPAFNYLVKNGLWYQQGVIKAAQAPGGIKFPTDAIAIKAVWKFITDADKPRFHWDEYEDPKTKKPVIVGLVALHITSKVLPNWHWATFEQEDNPGFGDYIGAHDSYGMIPANVPPNAEPNKGYKTELKPVLLERMRAAKLDPAWAHYRLKGAQIDFTDSTGRPTILGNSITEAGFVASSSCVTCHAKASGMLSGDPPKYTNLPVFRPDNQSDNGAPNPGWFWGSGAPPAVKFYQLDFLWELGFSPKYRTVP